MRRLAAILTLLALAGCGNSGIQGVLEWAAPPRVSERTLSGTLRNTTSHAEPLSAGEIRLLDEHGRRVRARIHVSTTSLSAHATAVIRATWRSGSPVRIDYGAGTLPLRPAGS